MGNLQNLIITYNVGHLLNVKRKMVGQHENGKTSGIYSLGKVFTTWSILEGVSSCQ